MSAADGPPWAVVTCMDGRLTDAAWLQVARDDAFIMRNAGGRVTDDVLRSLVVACSQGVRQIAIVHHTDCAMARLTQEELAEVTGLIEHVDFLTIGDVDEALRLDVERVLSCNLLPRGVEVWAYRFDVHSGRVETVARGNGTASAEQ